MHQLDFPGCKIIFTILRTVAKIVEKFQKREIHAI